MARNEHHANELMVETVRMQRYGLSVGRHALSASKARKPVARRGLLARIFGR